MKPTGSRTYDYYLKEFSASFKNPTEENFNKFCKTRMLTPNSWIFVRSAIVRSLHLSGDAITAEAVSKYAVPAYKETPPDSRLTSQELLERMLINFDSEQQDLTPMFLGLFIFFTGLPVDDCYHALTRDVMRIPGGMRLYKKRFFPEPLWKLIDSADRMYVFVPDGESPDLSAMWSRTENAFNGALTLRTFFTSSPMHGLKSRDYRDEVSKSLDSFMPLFRFVSA